MPHRQLNSQPARLDHSSQALGPDRAAEMSRNRIGSPTWQRFGVSILWLWLLPSFAADQPQWGEFHSRNMVSPETNLPAAFDIKSGLHVKWVAELGTETHSTPVIARGRVLIGTNNGHPRDPKHSGDRGVLMCLDEKDGKFLWQLVTPKYSSDPYQDWPNAGIVSSPVIEGDRVYVMDNRVEMLCLDLNGLANGNDGPFRDEARWLTPPGGDPESLGSQDADVIWVFDVIKEVGSFPHDGAHTAPLVDGRFLYVNTCNGVDNTHKRIRCPQAPSLIALEKSNGCLVAQDAENIGPRIFHSTWSSPSMGQVNGTDTIFFGGGDGVVYAFASLQQSSEPAPLKPSPASTNSPAKFAPALVRTWRFDCDPSSPKTEVHRYNGNRRESPSNIKSIPVYHQGCVYVTVGGDVWWGKHQAWLKCIKSDGSGDITDNHEKWSYPLRRHCMSTPAIANGLVFVGDCGGVAHAVDTESGKPVWTEELDGEMWASPLVADGKVYFATRNGFVYVFSLSRDKKMLARVELDGLINASPVAANGVLYIATMSRLYALQEPKN